jgi:hypothetical protein
MQIDKSLILDFLRTSDQRDKVDQVDQEFPDTVDTDKHQDLLDKFGLDPQVMVAKLAGGGGLGNIPGS